MSEQLHPQPISRETYDPLVLVGGAEAALDKKGNQYLFTDDATEANAHYAAENGKWKQFAQPGFEQGAKSIAPDAQKETAHEDALHEDDERWRAEQDHKMFENDLAAYNATYGKDESPDNDKAQTGKPDETDWDNHRDYDDEDTEDH